MIANGVEVHSAQLSRLGAGRQILKNGSSVLVRIINDKGAGKYEGSVAGVRVNISSARQLKVGDTFVASINAKDGTIYLNPKDAMASAMTMSFSEIGESGLMSFLSAMGLPADSLSVSVLQIIKQMGLKIDASMISKIRNLALHFTGKEKSAAELLAIISEKGIEASEEEVKQMLLLLEMDSENQNDENSYYQNNDKNLLNKINSKKGSWFLLPFEIIKYGHSSVLGRGCIRLLFDSSNMLKQMNLETFYNQQKYLFTVIYEGKKITDVTFNAGEVKSIENEISELKKRFIAAGINPGKIEWEESEYIEGSASGLENFYAFGGEF